MVMMMMVVMVVMMMTMMMVMMMMIVIMMMMMVVVVMMMIMVLMIQEECFAPLRCLLLTAVPRVTLSLFITSEFPNAIARVSFFHFCCCRSLRCLLYNHQKWFTKSFDGRYIILCSNNLIDRACNLPYKEPIVRFQSHSSFWISEFI